SSRRIIGDSTGKCGLPQCRRPSVTHGSSRWCKNFSKAKKEFFAYSPATRSLTGLQNSSARTGIVISTPNQVSAAGGHEHSSVNTYLRWPFAHRAKARNPHF